MLVVHLARHGTHDEVGRVLSGRSEIALNAAGQAEASGLAAMTQEARLPVTRIISSPRCRARQTAVPASKQLELPIETAPALDEIDFGGFTGRSFAQLDGDPLWQRWNAERHTARCPGGETMAEASGRAADFLFALPAQEGAVLCVTHCDVIRGLVACLLGLPFHTMFMFGCDPGSVTTLGIAPGVVQVIGLNRRDRL